jgi:signal transduction histidine kinase
MRFLSFNNAILGSIEDVIIVSDTVGRVVYQNNAARGLNGYQEVSSNAPAYIASVLDGRDLKVEFENVLQKSETVSVQFVPTRDGKHYYNVTISPIGDSGVLVNLHDATAQYELNQAKSDMVSLVSHELRTPLTSIRGYSDMLLKYDLVQEKGKPFLSTIIDESGRLNQLIQSFLDVAYIESGRHKISKTDFEVGPMLKDMVHVLEPVAAGKQIKIESAEINGLRLHADRLLVYQALSNLVINAIKYSPAGTSVRIGVANGNGRLRFLVSDEGYGIPTDDVTKIFDKFYRRDNKETREETGFGLGLAFTKEVAVRHGGDVVVESEVGKGSVFTLSIPN